MVNAVLSSLPTFLMSCLLLYKGIIDKIDKYRRHLFWRGKDLEKKNPPLAAWEMICRPKDKGGLGILNLHTQNTCLLMKMIHKFLNHYDIPWVHLIWEVYYQQGILSSDIPQCSFWWRDCLKLLATYKAHATCIPQDGKTIDFWQEVWEEIPKSQLWPHLYSFSKQQQIFVHEIFHTEDMADHFHLPLSEEAYAEFLQLEQYLQGMNLSADQDIWQFTPGQVTYKVSTAYATLTIAPEIIPAIKWLWKTCCQLKHKIFFWLLLNDRINTRALLQRKGFFLQDYTCVMCNLQALETRDHLFFHCQFAQLCWSYICTNWQPAYTGIQEEISNLKQLLSVPYAMEIIILTCWAIWTTRNDHIFQHIQPSIYRCRKKLKEELKWIIYRVKRKEYSGFEAWIKSFR